MRVSMNWLSAAAGLLLLVQGGCGPDYPKCDDDEDCRQGEFCVQGTCQQCRSDADCGEGRRCALGRCEDVEGYCRSDADCGDGERCESHRCVVAQAQQRFEEPAADVEAPACSLQSIYFDFDSDTLAPAARDVVQANVRCMRQLGIAAVHLTGHTDPRGTEEYNLALGERRARTVRDYMVALGVDANAIGFSSMGEEMAQGSDEAGWRRDRRVDVQPR